MCGIAGILNFNNKINLGLLKQMTNAISHRGPDDEGHIAFSLDSADYCILENNGPIPDNADFGLGLGHRRLSIIDLSKAGHQPMSNEDGTIWIVYNGEIYNFREFRTVLSGKGHKFASNTDTEVIIHAYEEWGIDCIRKFNGIFAFALWDSRLKKLVICRDRFGIKPLYYYKDDQRLLFASEIKSILQDKTINKRMNYNALNYYLTFLWVPGELTMFEGIYKLPPGCVMVISKNEFSISRYWEPVFEEDTSKSEEYYAEKVQECLEKAVERQLISDVPIGIFLSGGLDSSSILAAAKKYDSQKFNTFSIGIKEADRKYEMNESDLKYSRQLAGIFDINYHEIILKPDIVNLLPEVIRHLDEPIADPAAITSYLICRHAKGKATVLLSGQGGDEIFGGYPWHLAHKLSYYYNLIPGFLRRGLIERFAGSLNAAKAGAFAGLNRRIKRFVRSASLPEDRRYAGFCSYFDDEQRNLLLRDDVISQIKSMDACDLHLKYFNMHENQHYINRMLNVDINTFLPNLNLTYTDKTSMAHGIEARVPFLDNDLVDLTLKIPANLKIKGLTRKYILKKAAEKYLPKETIYRKKAGFGAPIRAWIMKDLREMVQSLLSEDMVNKRGVFNYSFIQGLLQNQFNGREDNSFRIYALLNLELWMQTFL